MKQWARWTEENKHFPKAKYGFTQYLKAIGDHVVTHPMTEAEYQKIKDAAKFWAWYHDKRVRIKKDRVGKGLFQITVTLISQHRKHIDRAPKYSI